MKRTQVGKSSEKLTLLLRILNRLATLPSIDRQKLIIRTSFFWLSNEHPKIQGHFGILIFVYQNVPYQASTPRCILSQGRLAGLYSGLFSYPK
jgi:hypothetical protein